jgi:nicotinamide-nucleotide amidase
MATPLNQPHNVAILSIGTELTTGEILNSNAAWLSSRITEFGLNCDTQITVPDRRDLMHWALEEAMDNHGIVVVTGGLGPTSDDFTREVIATSATTKLIWNEDAWNQIKRRLELVGAPIVESNQRQAYFPEGATIYQNNHGTAAAFSIRCGRSMIIALPGPPQEVEGLWNDHLKDFVASLAPSSKALKPLRWHCLGVSESKLGEIVEDALKESAYLTGYRTHMPYIDVKVWVPINRQEEFESTWRQKLESAISPWLVGHDGLDTAEKFRRHCPLAVPIYLLDRATKGYLAKRIYSEPLTPGCQLTVITSDSTSPMPTVEQGCMVVTISANHETGAWQVILTGEGPHESFSEQTPYKGRVHSERFIAYMGEKIMLKLIHWLTR